MDTKRLMLNLSNIPVLTWEQLLWAELLCELHLDWTKAHNSYMWPEWAVFFIRGKNNQRKQQIQMFFLISLYPVLVVISDINWMVVVLFSISLNMTQYECDSETSKKSKLQLFQADFILNCILNTCLRRLYLILS